ncbi:MAG: FtsW/RodA/SpoVE family cell cycle protein [Patescibacteria group bacterium]|nr:FtsW/RodA/SpoVE family cell cycle protein [Patescibacteria group bacterium]
MSIFTALIRKFKSFDWTIFFLFVLILIFSLVIHYSLSLGLEKNAASIFIRHLIFILFGLFLFFLFSLIDFRLLNFSAYLLYFLTLLLLILVLIFGKSFHGVKGWFFFGPVYFQPVELAKIVLIIVLAKILSEKLKKGLRLKDLFFSFVILFSLVFPILLQPDFGSALVICAVWLLMMILNLKKIKYLGYIFLILFLIFLFFWHFLFKDYQKARIITFLSPTSDPLGRGYQIAQAKIAIGAGGLFGRGIGAGSQAQLRFLPASQTDFIFAALAEEFGFLGAGSLLVLFLTFFLKMIKVARNIYDDFSFFLILGLAFNILIQAIINVSMNLGLLPIIGIPLPFISYGGSALIMNCLSLGLVQSAIIHQTLTKKEGRV